MGILTQFLLVFVGICLLPVFLSYSLGLMSINCELWHIYFFKIPAPPKISREMVSTLELNVGGSTVVKIPFSANPKPEVSWVLNGKCLPENSPVRCETEDGLTSLIFTNVTRCDSGNYTLTLKNEYGKCDATISVKVLGRHDAVFVMKLTF